MAVAAGATALAGLAVVRSDARPIWDGLTSGPGLAAVLASATAGAATVAFVIGRRYGPARVSAAAAVASIIAGWGIAQRPRFLPGLTIEQAAAGRSVISATLVALALGALILVPSLALLYALLLRGRFDEDTETRPAAARPVAERSTLPLLPAAGLCLVVGVAALVPFDSSWGRIIGVPCLLAFVALGFLALATAMTSPAKR
jgi:cytochrome d ubiquinol oxidase subunit II